jgi:hypothetical protein
MEKIEKCSDIVNLVNGVSQYQKRENKCTRPSGSIRGLIAFQPDPGRASSDINHAPARGSTIASLETGPKDLQGQRGLIGTDWMRAGVCHFCGHDR